MLLKFLFFLRNTNVQCELFASPDGNSIVCYAGDQQCSCISCATLTLLIYGNAYGYYDYYNGNSQLVEPSAQTLAIPVEFGLYRNRYALQQM
jgi:hypothetical protein